MLLPVTTFSQTLRAIIDASPHKDIISTLTSNWYKRITLEETGIAIYKDTITPATTTTSTQVGAWWSFNTHSLEFITLVAESNTNTIIDFNLE